MNIILIGFRGAGKTTVGSMLSQRLGKEFIDADEYLEQKEGKTIKDIFAIGGERLFREIEAQIIAELSLLNNKIIATGGGVILREENIKNLKRNGIFIFLDADAGTLYRRIGGDFLTHRRRPNLTSQGGYQEIQDLLEFRKPLYDKAADYVINTADTTLNDIVDKIVTFVHWYVMDLRH